MMSLLKPATNKKKKQMLPLETRLKREFTSSKKWLNQILDIIGWDFDYEKDFENYSDQSGNALFTREAAAKYNEQLALCIELFNYFDADIASYINEYLAENDNALINQIY